MLDVIVYPLLHILGLLWALVAVIALLKEKHASEGAAWLGYACLAFITAHSTFLMIGGAGGILPALALVPVAVLVGLAVAGVVFIRQRVRSADAGPKTGIVAVFAALAFTYAALGWLMHVLTAEG